MSERNKEIVRAAVTALSRGDYERFLADAADDLEFHVIGDTAFSGTVSGKATLLAQLDQALGDGLEGNLEMSIERLIAEGDFVAEQSTGQARTKGGVDYHNTYCRIWKIEDGSVQSITEYLDTEAVTQVLVG
ncbi:MAG: SnoaL-like domain-containing protein [Myxococcales bacterium]|nr:SnoaL-like domain-containing protein [Myxococcales bacterium]